MSNLPLLQHAFVRPPGQSYSRAISSAGISPDVAQALNEHKEYCQALQAAGLEVERLPPLEQYPDSCFMQDPAVILAGQAVIGRLGAPSRAGEEQALADLLQNRFPIQRISPPGTLEGGDVMIVPGKVIAGRSNRTNQSAIEQLKDFLAPFDLPVISLPVIGYLHLLTAITYLGENTLLAVDSYASHPIFAGFDVIIVPPEEAYAANALGVDKSVILPAGYSRVEKAVRARGFEVYPVPMSQFAAADGGITCLSLAW
jgi:dimethylargininase